MLEGCLEAKFFHIIIGYLKKKNRMLSFNKLLTSPFHKS